MDHECDRQTAYVRLVAPSVESIQTSSSTHSKGSVAVDSFRPVFNTLVRGEPVNTRTTKFGLKKLDKRYGVDIFTYGYFVLSGCTRLTDRGWTDGQTDVRQQ